MVGIVSPDIGQVFGIYFRHYIRAESCPKQIILIWNIVSTPSPHHGHTIKCCKPSMFDKGIICHVEISQKQNILNKFQATEPVESKIPNLIYLQVTHKILVLVDVEIDEVGSGKCFFFRYSDWLDLLLSIEIWRTTVFSFPKPVCICVLWPGGWRV